MTFVHDLSDILDEKRDEIIAWMNKKRSEIDVPIYGSCLLYTSPSPRDLDLSRMPSSA